MRSSRLNPIETLFFWTIALTWPLYSIGALYIVAPSIAWSMLAVVVVVLYFGSAIHQDYRVSTGIPLVVWSWILGMLGMLVVLWIGHFNWSLGTFDLAKSTIGWMKGWAMAAIFPLIGAVLPIRREPLIRAQSIVALCTLLLLPILLAAPYIGLPAYLFISPLSVFGGSGPEYFAVVLYTIEPETSALRWQFFAPWAPFAGLIGVVGILFALEDKNRRWMVIGVLGGLALILMSKSRISLVALAICVIVPRLTPLLSRGGAWQVMALVAGSMAILGEAAANLVEDTLGVFREARVGSSRLRETLQRIAVDRWGREAPWFGHGKVDRGPHLVEYMPIGSHHTWYGLLYVKGLVGVGALLVPMTYQFLFTMADALRGPRGRLPFGIMLAFLIQSLGENIEVEVYLFWPSFILLGIHAREVEIERTARVAARFPEPEPDGAGLVVA